MLTSWCPGQVTQASRGSASSFVTWDRGHLTPGSSEGGPGRTKGDNSDDSPEVGSLLLWVELCPPKMLKSCDRDIIWK